MMSSNDNCTNGTSRTVETDKVDRQRIVDELVEADNDDDNAKIFPQRLMEILTDEKNHEAINWLPHGKGFIIVNRQKFANEVLPVYFRKTKYTSFTRKLNRWNFSRVTRGPELGAYYHEFFQRGNEALCTQMYCKNERAKFAVAARENGKKALSPSIRKEERPMPLPERLAQTTAQELQGTEQSLEPLSLSAAELMQLGLLKSTVPSIDPAVQTRMLLAHAAHRGQVQNAVGQKNLLLQTLLGNAQSRTQQPPNQQVSSDAVLGQFQQFAAIQQQWQKRAISNRGGFSYRASAA